MKSSMTIYYAVSSHPLIPTVSSGVISKGTLNSERVLISVDLTLPSNSFKRTVLDAGPLLSSDRSKEAISY